MFLSILGFFWKGPVVLFCGLGMSILWGPRKGALSWDDYFMGPLPISNVSNVSNVSIKKRCLDAWQKPFQLSNQAWLSSRPCAPKILPHRTPRHELRELHELHVFLTKIDANEVRQRSAKRCAKLSKSDPLQVGACIVNDRNRIIGVGALGKVAKWVLQNMIFGYFCNEKLISTRGYNGMPSNCPNEDLPWGKKSTSGSEGKFSLESCHSCPSSS